MSSGALADHEGLVALFLVYETNFSAFLTYLLVQISIFMLKENRDREGQVVMGHVFTYQGLWKGPPGVQG